MPVSQFHFCWGYVSLAANLRSPSIIARAQSPGVGPPWHLLRYPIERILVDLLTNVPHPTPPPRRALTKRWAELTTLVVRARRDAPLA